MLKPRQIGLATPAAALHGQGRCARLQAQPAERPATSCSQEGVETAPQPARRVLLAAPLAAAALAAADVVGRASPSNATAIVELLQSDSIQDQAMQRYADRDFVGTLEMVSELVRREPQEPRWHEMRAQVLVDFKDFDGALQDFNAALEMAPASEPLVRARLLSGRALAFEGLADWRGALGDYTQALEVAATGGGYDDPYVLNSRGNVHASLGEWAAARDDYLRSSEGFQRAKGFRGQGGSTTPRLDGAIYSASNAALMLVQMGDEDGALKEMQRIARRAPGSADMRAALAALYWRRGQAAAAEAEWQFACDQIKVGCLKYQDADWLSRIRRWPPRMCANMLDFLKFEKPQGGSFGVNPALIEGF